MATPKNDSVKLSPAQIRILQTLARYSDGLTRGKIQEKAGVCMILTAPLGPIDKTKCREYDEKNGFRSLHSLGYVQVELRPGANEECKDVYVFTLTPDGEDAAERYATRRPRRQGNKVPDEILAPVGREFSILRTYVQEDYTDDDLRDVRTRLGDEYSDIPLTEIRRQLVNLRKRGGLKQEKAEKLPYWYEDYRETPHWEELEGKIAKWWDYACSANPDHKDDLCIVHRRYTTLGNESPADVLVLCAKCRNRLRAALPPIPEEAPAESEYAESEWSE